ncbi:hypothetical protein TNCV_4340971 [Trichonephila clavipes]|nr:hypothetical protein TNCV_4340971 [Trichonephila clavipes]
MFLDCLCVVNTFPWPERSPDLLPIEHVWNMVKPHIRAPQNITDLKQQLVYAWHNVSQDGMPSRHKGTPNSRRAASPLVRLVEEKEKWEAPSKLGSSRATSHCIRERSVAKVKRRPSYKRACWGSEFQRNCDICCLKKGRLTQIHSSRSLFGFDFVVFERGEQKPPVEKASVKLAGSNFLGETIVNKYLQNNKEVNRNGLTVVDFDVVACVAGSVVEAFVGHQS